MAGTVTSDAVCAQKVYARGCSAAGNDRWRGSSPPVRSRPGHEITSHECLETALLPPGVTEVAYVPGLIGRLVRGERERVCILCAPLFKAHMQQCRTLRRNGYTTPGRPGPGIRTEPKEKRRPNIKQQQAAVAAAAVTTHQLQLRSLCFASLAS